MRIMSSSNIYVHIYTHIYVYIYIHIHLCVYALLHTATHCNILHPRCTTQKAAARETRLKQQKQQKQARQAAEAAIEAKEDIEVEQKMKLLSMVEDDDLALKYV